MVKQLLDKNADIETQDRWGHTPLLWAAKGDPKRCYRAEMHVAVAKQLLEKNADVETKDSAGGHRFRMQQGEDTKH